MRSTTMTRTVVAGLVAIGMLTSACSGPGGGGSLPGGALDESAEWGEATGTVEFWDTNANPVLTAAWQELIAEFEVEHPDIDVEYVGLPNSSYLQKLDNALASGQVPDVALVGNDVAHFIAQNAMTPLDGAFDRDLAELVDTSLVEEERSNAPDGALYKAPLTALSDVLWYRTDWLADAGLKVPATWDEFYDVAEAVTDKNKGKFGFAFRGGAGSIPPLFSMAYGMSGIDEFYTGDGEATLDDPAMIDAIERYVSLFTDVSASADLTNDYPKIVAAFGGGSAWSMHHNLGSYQDHISALGAENIRGAQPYPDEYGVATATAPAISGLGILNGSDNKAAAWEFVKFMSTQGNSAWAEAVGQVPANLEAIGDQWVADSQPLQDILALSANHATQYVRLPVYLPDYGSILKTEMEPDLQSVLQGSMTVEAFATTYAERFEEALVEYQTYSAR